MNLYVYASPNDFTAKQIVALKKTFSNVAIIETNEFKSLYNDPEPKVIALDPDIVGWKFSNEIIDRIPELKAICLETTGYEWIDNVHCAKRGIAVTNVPHYATNAVAEKCVMMALALAKKLPLFQGGGTLVWNLSVRKCETNRPISLGLAKSDKA